jgi:hypothetical protein
VLENHIGSQPIEPTPTPTVARRTFLGRCTWPSRDVSERRSAWEVAHQRAPEERRLKRVYPKSGRLLPQEDFVERVAESTPAVPRQQSLGCVHHIGNLLLWVTGGDRQRYLPAAVLLMARSWPGVPALMRAPRADSAVMLGSEYRIRRMGASLLRLGFMIEGLDGRRMEMRGAYEELPSRVRTRFDIYNYLSRSLAIRSVGLKTGIMMVTVSYLQSLP